MREYIERVQRASGSECVSREEVLKRRVVMNSREEVLKRRVAINAMETISDVQNGQCQ